MSKDFLEKKEIASIMIEEILKLEKDYVKDVNPLTQKEMVTKISNKFEEVFDNYDSKKNGNN